MASEETKTDDDPLFSLTIEFKPNHIQDEETWQMEVRKSFKAMDVKKEIQKYLEETKGIEINTDEMRLAKDEGEKLLFEDEKLKDIGIKTGSKLWLKIYRDIEKQFSRNVKIISKWMNGYGYRYLDLNLIRMNMK